MNKESVIFITAFGGIIVFISYTFISTQKTMDETNKILIEICENVANKTGNECKIEYHYHNTFFPYSHPVPYISPKGFVN